MDTNAKRPTTSIGRQTKSAPCAADRHNDTSVSSSFSSLDTRDSRSSHGRDSSEFSLSATSDSSDSESVPRSAPGDWSTNSSSPSSSVSSQSDEKCFYNFPYNGSGKDGAGHDASNSSQSGDDYADDFEAELDDFSSSRDYRTNGELGNSRKKRVSISTDCDHSKSSNADTTGTPFQFDRWRQWRKNNGMDETSDDDSAVSRSSESDSAEDDSDLVGINGSRNSKQYKAQVLRRLIAEFDAKQTMRHYRNMHAVTYQFDPKEFSLECSMEAHHMKKRLVHLTGSDKIRANDMDYMDKLRAKIWEEYEEELQRKEEEREENERQRMRRLMARGIIGPEEMRSDKVLWGEYRRNTNIYEQKYRGKRRKKTPRSPRKEVPDKSMRAKSAPQTRQEMKKVGASSGSFGTLRSGSKCHQPGYNDRGDLSRRQSTPARPTTSVGPRSTLSRNFHTGSSTMSGPSHLSLTSQSVESRRGSASTVGADTDTDSSDYINYRLGARQRRHEHPIVQQMRREQTVSGLYSLAEKACPIELRDKYTSNSKKETKGEEEYAYNPNRKVKIKF